MSEMKWIPIIDTLPPLDEYILLSFSNFPVPVIGRYEEDDEGGGKFYAGDEDVTLISQDMYVDAWMELPKPYKNRNDGMARILSRLLALPDADRLHQYGDKMLNLVDVLNLINEEMKNNATGNS